MLKYTAGFVYMMGPDSYSPPSDRSSTDRRLRKHDPRTDHLQMDHLRKHPPDMSSIDR